MTTEPGYRFIKVHQGFPEHWKTAELSDRAFRDLITAWCFCLRNMTDGFITDSQSSKLFSRKSRAELLKNYMRPMQGGGYQMHEFDQHQLTTDKVSDLQRKRSVAGQKGGKARASAIASAKQVPKQTGSKPVADRDRDVDRETTTTTPPSGERSRRREPTPRGHRLPADWQPPQELVDALREECPLVDITRELRKFVDYWHPKTGQSATKITWDGTFRNWIRKAEEDLGKRGFQALPGTTSNRPPRRDYDAELRQTLAMGERLQAKADAEAANVRSEIMP